MQREFWNDIGRTSDDGETSGPFLPTPTASQYGTCQGGSMGRTGKVRHSLASMLKRGELTSSAPDSPARICQSQEAEKGWTASTADCFSTSSESFAFYDPHTSSWRTRQRSLFEDLIEFSERWPRSGFMLAGTVYRLLPLVPRISATASLSSRYVPTPSARDHKSGRGATQQERGRTKGPSLAEVSGGMLAPNFVEYLMGFPEDWTKLD